MKVMRFAELIGETTLGGAHPVRNVPLTSGFEMFVPYARAENPITGTNWEGVGVVPDIVVSSADPLKVALEQLGLSPSSSDIDALSRSQVF
jgi:C-terminal processing protease CtpA/Prc